MSELYTKLFVRTDHSHAELLAQLAAALQGDVEGWTIALDDCEIDVRLNDEASASVRAQNADNFLYFPYTVEVVCDSVGGDVERYVSRVGSIMNTLHQAGMAVVAACDWEERLPGGGRLPQQN